jgi:hypothetical protein
MTTAGCWVLGGVAALEGLAALSRFRARQDYFAAAQARAQATHRKLVVIGNPSGGAHTRLIQAYGCGDVCVDLVGCDGCAQSITADITQGVPGIRSDSAVVFVSCVLEYVNDPQAAYREILRMAGSPDNIWIVPVQPYTFTSMFYPGAKSMIDSAPPGASGLTTQPVTGAEQLLYVLIGGALIGWAAS